ncbi:type I-U CRISPR-associated RAMP protein Csb1/Cas7u [Myxococcota bacterium]|nr:type I-U CRISPR-associated RAMP protein Csb1/Cas7u [Myxococcota bacterium]
MTNPTPSPLTLELLTRFVAGDAVAIRGRATLTPAGGPGDKVFPPSHSVDKNEKRPGAKYAFERRRIGGREIDCVLLDSVQSQANRMEEALQALWADKRLAIPVITVDFSKVAPDVGVVTSLTAPHRVADALLRDSLLDGVLFRLSDLGKSFTDATPRNATPLFSVCPTGLVFGIWDSTGPKGGLGAKFARVLVSEIIGIDATNGVKTASRIDPTGIVTRAAEILQADNPDERWTHDPAAARKEKGKPVKLGDGKVSEVNHSNVPPTIETLAGGVTIDHAEQTVVLSLAGLRKLGFGEANDTARTYLAALALVAVLAASSRGHDLRSRCLLVPTEGGALALEAVRGDGTVLPLNIDLEQALALLGAAAKALPKALQPSTRPGEPLAVLQPTKKLAHLVTESRKLAAVGADDEGE